MATFSAPWVDGFTIGEMLRQTAGQHPQRDAVVFPNLDQNGRPNSNGTSQADSTRGHTCYRLSYRQLDADVDRVARALIGLGIEHGQHVAVWATNWPRWVLLQYATARIGAVQVNINPAYRSSELAYVLRQSAAVALFLIDRFRTSSYFEMVSSAVAELSSSEPGQLESSEYPDLRHVVSMSETSSDGIWDWDEFIRKGDSVSDDQVALRQAALQPGQAINIQYTSGTTGFPKGAMLTHRNLLLNAYYVGDCQRFTEADRLCVPVPFYHCFGCVLGVLVAAVYGASLVIPDERFDPQSTLYAIEIEQATAVYGVPTMFIGMLEHPTFAASSLQSIRTGIMAGSPCPIELMKRVVDEMSVREITIAYGLTEASPVITQTRTDDPLELRVQTVGQPIPEIEVKIVDPDTGKTLDDEQQGELCARGHVVMLGYYNMPEQTAATIDEDGWLHSGDLAMRMANGYYRITGRIKDMICRGGENIYPREIEEFLYTHPAVQDVAVIGVPDTKFVEQVAAWIILRPDAQVTEDEIRQFCKDKLAHFKVPRYVRFVEQFPQTVTGKIQKFKIRQIMIQDLGLEHTETA